MPRSRIFQGFKYAIYVFLTLDLFRYFNEEFAAAGLKFHDGVVFAHIIEAYAATIDTLAWVVLLLLFELETVVVPAHHGTKRVVWTLQTVRVISYIAIVYAFYGYIINLAVFDHVVPLAGISDLCALVDQWSYSTALDEYVAITRANCQSFSAATMFFQFPGMHAVIDAQGLAESKALAWVDVINSATWLLVVLVLEIDVRLQENHRLTGAALAISNVLKVVLYLVLLLAAIYWGVKGTFLDFWDACLWLVAFFFIELNVVEWRHEGHADSASGRPTSG